MAIITVFAVISTSVCILFRTTDFSIPNDAWHTIAQMSESAEISSILSRSKLKTDDQVLELSKELQDEDEEGRSVVRNGAFVRASSFSTARDKDTEAQPRLRGRLFFWSQASRVNSQS
ncbi:hypothetical protein CCHR01_00110 [Colletotrichum chrysophilum]|uniref:Integral membrane protein n=1 Tax=Colletotrichum chrysophilum TaxID=1836956 RepID=A0AAD9B4I3_9PEZI|nr:hypothetical protein CCHR01_00110 [Colletotrichum chrysophilum]